MAKRRTKRPGRRRKTQTSWKRLRARFAALFQQRAAAFQLPHSSVFAAGVAIGLAAGLALGLGVIWLGARSDTKTSEPVTVAKSEAETSPEESQRTVAVPPAYVEETEPSTDEAPDSVTEESTPVLPAMPPAVAESNPPMQPALPPTTETQPLPPQTTPPDDPQSAVLPSSIAPPQSLSEQPGPGGQQAWMRNAVASIETGGKPMIAIVLDDVGAAPNDVPGAIALPAPITLSIMTYATGAARIAETAHRAGHEIMVHVPMEPINRDADPGHNALLTNLPPAEIKRRVEWDLAQFPGYVGINNHMGSKFTQDAAGMRLVLEMVKARGLIYLDSKTIAGSVGDKLAAQMGVSHVVRDVFLDDVIDESDILRQLQRTEAIARKQGFAIAIGHPHPDTVATLMRWIPKAEADGFVLVPLSQIVKKREGVTG